MQSCIYESDYETFTTNLRKHEELNMKRRMIWIAPLAILAMVLFVTLGGYVVTHLWNWLLPGLFGLAADYFLARAWTAGIVPDTLWRIPVAWAGPL